MHRSGLLSTAATATLPPRDVPDPLLTRGPPASNGLAPPDSSAAAPAELIRYLTQDHDRIAQGLNDVVVPPDFRRGTGSPGRAGTDRRASRASKIWHAIDELDQAVKDIRDTIFDATGVTHGPDAKSTQG